MSWSVRRGLGVLFRAASHLPVRRNRFPLAPKETDKRVAVALILPLPANDVTRSGHDHQKQLHMGKRAAPVVCRTS
jgi:hypothetical protein